MSVTQASLLGDTFGSKASGTIPVGGIIMWSGSTASIPTGWSLCNGSNGTPNLRDRFVVGAGSGYGVGATGGAATVTLTTAQMPSHNHGASTGGAGGHAHSGTTNGAGAHSHSISDPGHQHTVPTVRNGSTQSGGGDNGGSNTNSISSLNGTGISINGVGDHAHSFSTSGVGDHAHSVSVGNTGGEQAHENRPPYYALAFIMRVS